MKTRLIIGAIFIGFLLMLVPSIPAVEYKTTVDTNTSQFIAKLKSIDVDALEQKFKSIGNPILQEKLKTVDVNELKQELATGHPIDVKYLICIINLILSLIIAGNAAPFKLKVNTLIGIFSMSTTVIQEFVTGNLSHYNSTMKNLAVSFSFFNILIALNLRFIENKQLYQTITKIESFTMIMIMWVAVIRTVLHTFQTM